MQVTAELPAVPRAIGAWLATCGLAFVCLGCTMAPTPPLSARILPRKSGLARWTDPREIANDPLLASTSDPRVGSALAGGTPLNATTAADPRALNDVMAQLRSLGAVDPAVQAKLMEDLQRTDPSLWPLLMQTYRTSIAYQNMNRSVSANNPGGSATPTGQQATSPYPQEITDARNVSPETRAQIAQLNPQRSPWGALTVPNAAAVDEVRLAQPAALAQSTPTQSAPQSPPPQNPPAQSAAAPAPAASAVAAASTPAAPVTPPPSPAAATTQVATDKAPAATEPPLLPAGAATPIAAAAPAATPTPAPAGEVQQTAYASPSGDPPSDETLNAAISALEKQGQGPVQDAAGASRQVSLRMLYLAAGRREDALRPIQGLPPDEQEYWNKQLAGISALLDTQAIPDAAQRAATARNQLTEAANRLAQLSPLVVRNLTFCTEVSSYGVVTKFTEPDFAPGQQVLLYGELENFKTAETPKGFHTSLKSSYQILDKSGAKMAGTEPQVMEEYCQNARRDYFVRYRLALPKPLPDGAYTLQLTVEDTLGQKTGKASLDFNVKEKK